MPVSGGTTMKVNVALYLESSRLRAGAKTSWDGATQTATLELKVLSELQGPGSTTRVLLVF